MWNARVTSHVPLRAVADLLTVEVIVEVINPHPGDGGQIGREEIEVIAPAVARAQARQIRVDGPFPSDTL